MKKRLRILVGGMVLAAMMVSSAWALELDYDLVTIPNDGTWEEVTVDHSRDTSAKIKAYGYLQLDFPATDENTSVVRIFADENTYIGMNAVDVMYVNENQETDVKTIYVNVYDVSKPSNLHAFQTGSKVKLGWANTQSYYFQIQYRVKGGKWKTAAKKYSIEENIATEGRSYTFKNLKAGQTYQFRLRPVTPCYEWGTKYGPWSDVITYKVK